MMMMRSKPLIGFIIFVVLLFASQDMTKVGVAVVKASRVNKPRLCESQSHGFKGQCWSSHNCALVCRHEGFTGGKCRGFRHRCFCTKPCHRHV